MENIKKIKFSFREKTNKSHLKAVKSHINAFEKKKPWLDSLLSTNLLFVPFVFITWTRWIICQYDTYCFKNYVFNVKNECYLHISTATLSTINWVILNIRFTCLNQNIFVQYWNEGQGKHYISHLYTKSFVVLMSQKAKN